VRKRLMDVQRDRLGRRLRMRNDRTQTIIIMVKEIYYDKELSADVGDRVK
jgi:hypothetical protein